MTVKYNNTYEIITKLRAKSKEIKGNLLKCTAKLLTKQSKSTNLAKMKKIVSQEIKPIFDLYSEAMTSADPVERFNKLMKAQESTKSLNKQYICLVELSEKLKTALTQCGAELKTLLSKIFFRKIDNLLAIIRISFEGKEAVFLKNLPGVFNRSCFVVVKESFYSEGLNVPNKVNVKSMSDAVKLYKFEETEFLKSVYKLVNWLTHLIDSYMENSKIVEK